MLEAEINMYYNVNLNLREHVYTDIMYTVQSLRTLAWEAVKAAGIHVPNGVDFDDLVERDRQYSAHHIAYMLTRPIVHKCLDCFPGWTISLVPLHYAMDAIFNQRAKRISQMEMAVQELDLDDTTTGKIIRAQILHEFEFWGVLPNTGDLGSEYFQLFLKKRNIHPYEKIIGGIQIKHGPYGCIQSM